MADEMLQLWSLNASALTIEIYIENKVGACICPYLTLLSTEINSDGTLF